MNNKENSSPDQPYKFIDYYDKPDKDIFFGRETEIEILLSDIISTRLVVLFSKTGCGKTSLINAGVRPRLEELHYKTLYMRVGKDPNESIREALICEKLITGNFKKESLQVQLKNAVEYLQKPIVLFIDQFEEFFIYVINHFPEKAQQFISEIAKIYHNKESGIHVVLSISFEEFFVAEMEWIRNEIPSIFNYNSNLRLRDFDENQARDAILLPAKKYEVEFEDNLIENLITDLRNSEGRIEPIQLQIVCDTLWRQRINGHIRFADYIRLNRAIGILDNRLREDIEQNLDNDQLQLFEFLIPELSTKYGTKYIRAFDELVRTLNTDASSLRNLVKQLKELRLLRESTCYNFQYIEWTSDYLAQNANELQKKSKAISLRRLLKSVMDEAEKIKSEIYKKKLLEQDNQAREYLDPDEIEKLYMNKEDFEKISEGLEFLSDLTQAETEFLLVASLEHGEYMMEWFDKASSIKVDVWQLLEDKIVSEDLRLIQAENTIRLLCELRTEEAMELLELAMQQDTLSSQTVDALGDMRTQEAIGLLKKALQKKDLASQVIDVLRRMRTMGAVDVLELALHNKYLAPKAEKILDWFSRIGTDKLSIQASSVLENWKELQMQSMIEYRRQSFKDSEEIFRYGMDEKKWEVLLRMINNKNCTPFLGAEACWPILPQASEVSRELATRYDYPLPDKENFSRVAQFIATETDPIYLKFEIIEMLQRRYYPKFSDNNDIYRNLAELPFPIYITTNYDNFMLKALERVGRNPEYEYCRWNRYLDSLPKRIDDNFIPSVNNPLVYHLYGTWEEPHSIVITEDDYIDFNITVTRDILGKLPSIITRSLSGTTKIFIGYNLQDVNFRTLFKSIIYIRDGVRPTNIATQLHPLDEHQYKVKSFFEDLKYKITHMTSKNEYKDKISQYIYSLEKIIDQDKIDKKSLDLFYKKTILLEELIIKTPIENFPKESIFHVINNLKEEVIRITHENMEKNIKAWKSLEKYFERLGSSIYWGEPNKFASQLLERWEHYKYENK